MFGLTNLDWIFFIVIIASTVLATVRGGVFETLATLSWLLAWMGARFLGPFVDDAIKYIFGLSESGLISMAVSYFIVFILILFISKRISRKIHDSIGMSYFMMIDHTFGVLFGILRGIVIMGLVYWATLWYVSDDPVLPKWLVEAKTRPVMQYTALALNDLFLVKQNKLLEADISGTEIQNQEIYDKLIKPVVQESENPAGQDNVGYQSSERKDLENQLLKLDAIGSDDFVADDKSVE